MKSLVLAKGRLDKMSTSYVFKLDESTRKYCEENLHESEETRENALKTLKQWSQENPEYHIKDDDLSLLAFLRGCKFNIERTKKKLLSYYTQRRDIPEWYSNRDPSLPEIQELVKLGVFVPLRKHHNNQLIVFIKTAAHDPRKHKQNDVFKAGNMVLDIATKDNEEAQIYGITAIFDMDGISLGHARQLTPNLIKKAVESWQNYHCRPKRLEFVNAPLYINVVLSIFKGFMSEKLKSRVRVHFNGLEDFSNILPKEVVPTEYGGDGESMEELVEYWQQKLKDSSEWFKDDELYKAE